MINTINTSALHHPTLRVLRIFEAVYQNDGGLTLSELSRSTGVLKGTLHPIVSALLQENYLQRSGSRFKIGKNCFKLGYSYVNSLNYLDIIKPHMRDVVTACGEICQLGILDGGDVLYVDKAEPDQAIRIESSAGHTAFAYATALGKCLLSGLTDKEVRALYPRKFVQYTQYTTPDVATLLKQLEAIRIDGYAHETGEMNEDIECVGIPLRVHGKIAASISVSLPRFRSSQKKVEQIASTLKSKIPLIENEISLVPKTFNLFSN